MFIRYIYIYIYIYISKFVEIDPQHIINTSERQKHEIAPSILKSHVSLLVLHYVPQNPKPTLLSNYVIYLKLYAFLIALTTKPSGQPQKALVQAKNNYFGAFPSTFYHYAMSVAIDPPDLHRRFFKSPEQVLAVLRPYSNTFFSFPFFGIWTFFINSFKTYTGAFSK